MPQGVLLYPLGFSQTKMQAAMACVFVSGQLGFLKQQRPPGTRPLGLESSLLERVVIPSHRIPCDDSAAKVRTFYLFAIG